MCTRFTTLRMTATHSPNDVGCEATGQDSCPAPDGASEETTSPVADWRLADIEPEPVAVIAARAAMSPSSAC